jgi:hypothetical protein
MNIRLLLAPILVANTAAFAADLPKIPAEPVAKKKELLFSDDFERKDLGQKWRNVVPTFTLENGALKGTQMRWDAPAADGKPAVKGHQAVTGSDVPTKDSIIELRFKFGASTALSVEFDDRNYTGSHYGHICFVRMSPKGVNLADQRDGSMKNEIYAMTEPSQAKEKAKLMVGRSVMFPLELDTSSWHTLALETAGDSMRATIDGKPAAFLKSSGIAHPTKSKIELGCAGKDGYFDDIKIWNAEPAKS